MYLDINPGSPTPIYAQIAESIRVAVATGELSSGEGLPSVRAMAGRLRVNPATVVQAYRELEREGVIEMRQGAGTFVSDVATDARKRDRTAAARRLARQLLVDGARLGLSPTELHDALTRELPENK